MVARASFTLALVAVVVLAVARQIHAFEAPVQIHFDSFQIDRRYAEIAIVGEVSLNKTLFLQGEPLDSDSFSHKYSDDTQLCSAERCYNVPLLTHLLEGAGYLFCGDIDFFAPARLFPLYRKLDGDIATVDDILRREGQAVSSLQPARDGLMFVVFAPSAEQNFTHLTHGQVNFMQFSSKETNASASPVDSLLKRIKFSVNITQCTIRVLTPDITIEAPDGEGIDFAAHIVYPPHLACNFTYIRPLMDKMLNASRDMAAATDRVSLLNHYDEALSALSHHQWTYCNWLTESLVAFKEQERVIPDTMNCWETPGSAAYARDPCCNSTLLWENCCAPRNQSTLLPEWIGWHRFASNTFEGRFFTTFPECKSFFTASISKEVTEGISNRPTRTMTALNDWALWRKRAMDPVRGCEGVPFITPQIFSAVRSVYASCLDDLYGTPAGTSNRCFADSDCRWGLECNEVTQRCDIPWESPALPLAKCLLDRKKQYVHQYFLWLLNLPQVITPEKLAEELKSKFETDEADCVGPTSAKYSGQISCFDDIDNRPDECRAVYNASGCLAEHQCNWHPCPTSNLDGKTCQELCEDTRIPGQSVCGWCSEGDFGECYSASEAPGCVAPSAFSRGECDIYAASNGVQTFWEPLDRVCYIISLATREQCIGGAISCSAPSPAVVPQTVWLKDMAEDSSLPAHERIKLAQQQLVQESSGTPHRAPGSEFVTDLNWNRTVCPQVCFDRTRSEPECRDENCDHPCCNREATCTDATVRACVCSIDAFCCDNWDEHCNRKAIDDGCVNCNCVRRSWDRLMNSGQGLCKVLMSTQEFCEDPWRGNGTWFSGRTWRHGRFSTKERCDEGSCDTDLTADTGKCRLTQGCEGPLCKKCMTSKGPSSPDYSTVSQACGALSETQCYQCIYGLSSCAVNQSEALCIMSEEPCADRPTCERYGRCSDTDYLMSDTFFGRCVVDMIQTENSTAACPQAAVPLDLTPIGCIASTISDPILCTIDTVGADDPQWRYPSTDQQSCLIRYGAKCTQVTKELGFGINSTIETWGKSCAECVQCGGRCEPATVWLAGKWRIGKMLPMRWMPRDYAPVNRGIATLNHTMVKQVLEDAIQYRLRDSLASDVLCRYSGLGATMQKLADICMTHEVEQRHHSALRHPALIAQRTIFWNQAERIDLQPAYIEISPDAVSEEDVRVDIRVTLYSMMDAYVNGTTPAKRDLAIDVVKLEPSGFLFGQLIGDGVRIDIYDASDDRRARKLKPQTAKLCIDVRNHPDLKWRQIFPVADLATVSAVVHPDTTEDKFEAFVPMMLESTKNLTEFPGLWYEYNETTGEFQRMCISLNSSGLWYPSTRMAAVVTVTAWMPYVAIASFAVIFALAGRKFMWMLLYDRTKHRLMKPVTAFGSAVTAAMRIVLMIIVVRTRWQRAYPEDFVLWNAFDWTSKLFMMLATEMFVVTNDVSARTGYCTNPVRLWWISLPAQLAIAAVFFVGFLRQFPLPDWSQEALEEFYRMEYIFNYVLSGTALIALFFLALYVVIKARTKRGRILTIVVSLITLAYYSRIIVWTYFDTFFGNLDKFWWHVGEMMLFELVILFIIVFFHDATERLDSKNDREYTNATAVELDQALDDGSLPTRDELSPADIDEINAQGDKVVAESERLIARMDGFIKKAGGGINSSASSSSFNLGDESSSGSNWGSNDRRSVVQLLDDEEYTIPEVLDQIDWNLRQIVSSGRAFETTAQSVLQKRGILGQMGQDSQKRSDEQFGRSLADAVREFKSEKELSRRPDRPTTMQIVERNLTDFPEMINDGLDDDSMDAPPPRVNFGTLPPPRASRVIARMQQDAEDRARLEQVRAKLEEEEQRRQIDLDASEEDDDEQSSESDSRALLAPDAGTPADASSGKKKNIFGRLKSALKKGEKKTKTAVIEDASSSSSSSAFSSAFSTPPRHSVRFADRPLTLPPPSGAPSARASRSSFRNASQVPVLWRSLLQSSGVRKSEMYDPNTALFVANIVNDVLGGDLQLDRFDGADLSQLPSLGMLDSSSLKSVAETLTMVMNTRREDSGLSFEGATDNDWTRD